MCSHLMRNMGLQYQLLTVADSFNWEIPAFKILINLAIHSSNNYHRHSASLWRLMQFCTAVWLHVKLHLVLPLAGTECLGRISVGFWCIITSRDGEGRIQTGRGFRALLSTLMRSPTRKASPPCSQCRNTTAPHYITLAEAPKGDLHSCARHDWF